MAENKNIDLAIDHNSNKQIPDNSLSAEEVMGIDWRDDLETIEDEWE